MYTAEKRISKGTPSLSNISERNGDKVKTVIQNSQILEDHSLTMIENSKEDPYIEMRSHSILSGSYANIMGTLTPDQHQNLCSDSNLDFAVCIKESDDAVKIEPTMDNGRKTSETSHCTIYPVTKNSCHYTESGPAVSDNIVLPSTVFGENELSGYSHSIPGTEDSNFSKSLDISHVQSDFNALHTEKLSQCCAQEVSSSKFLSHANQQASTRVGIHGNVAFDVIRLNSEFSNCSSFLIRNALQKCKNDPKAAAQEIRVRKLMEMGVRNVSEIDCVRALSHCQQKTDRAAEWLLLISEDIKDRAQ